MFRLADHSGTNKNMATSSHTEISRAPGHEQRLPCPGAIVMGANYRALALVRSLGRRGIPVWVLNQDSHKLAGFSRYTHRSLPWPPGDHSSRIEDLLSLAVKHQLGGALLLPTDDEGVILISKNHGALSQRFSLTTPPWDSLRWAFDKRLMYKMAQNIGIHQPRTFFPRNSGELRSIECPFPVIIKPAMRLELNRLTISKAWQVEDRKMLLARYDEACSLLSPDLVMIQEFLPGGGELQFSYAALCDEGHPIASLTAKRLRQFPMDFGRFSTLVESVDQPGVVGPALRLLRELRYTGLVEVEFKLDPQDGEFKLLDINTRVWGWQSLCGRAGVDFPYLLWLLTQGQAVPDTHAQTGVRWARMGADAYTSFLELLRRRLSARSYVQSVRGPIEWAIFAADDPLPFLCQGPAIAYLLAKRILRA
jgi:D-aspartate ligase